MKSLSLILAALMLVAGPAFAGDTHGAPQGASSGREAHEQAATTQPADVFSALDANHDGVLSRAEMRLHPKAAHMAMVDENGDGVLSREEFDELDGM